MTIIPNSHFGSGEHRNCLPCPASINLLPISSDTKADPFNTISMTVFHALGDNLSDGEIKFPAALLITILGRPNSATHLSTAVLMAIGSLTSATTGKTLNKKQQVNIPTKYITIGSQTSATTYKT